MSEKNLPEKDLLKMFPNRRISPFDGMAVTAEVWEEAHAYHRRRQQLYALSNYGAGIVTGLDVIASSPPDLIVYILPGIAIDSAGQVIVLTEPVAYDFGDDSDGLVYLLLSYWQSRPTTAEGETQESGIRFVFDEFAVHARPTLPETPWVELGRVRRAGRTSPILDASDAAHPQLNELDLRFRREIGAAPHPVRRVAVGYVGEGAPERHAQSMDYLARAVARLGLGRAVVDRQVALTAQLGEYDLLYLVGQGAFQLTQDEMKSLYAYIQEGGTVFYESCRQGTSGGDPPADAAFADLMTAMNIELAALPPDHAMLTEPFLFGAPPAGFEIENVSDLLLGDGVIWSKNDYGCLWQGRRRGRAATRAEIRAAMEWGSNILACAASRREAFKKE